MTTLKNMTAEAVELLKRLIATPSVSRNEKEAADIMQNFMEEKGLSPQRHGNNVWAVCADFNEEKPTILLNAHIDTVRPVDGWAHDPFAPTMGEDGDTLYGLGSKHKWMHSVFHIFVVLGAVLQYFAVLLYAI